MSIELPNRAIELLREGARSGKSTTELIKDLRRALDLDTPRKGRGKVISLFAAAFDVRISQTTILSGWVGFGYEGGNLTDEYINDYFEKFLKPYRDSLMIS